MIAPHPSVQNDQTVETLAAMRELFSRNPCAARFGVETISKVLCEERYLSYPVAAHEVECMLEVLRIDGEVIA